MRLNRPNDDIKNIMQRRGAGSSLKSIIKQDNFTYLIIRMNMNNLYHSRLTRYTPAFFNLASDFISP
jgi:hypothetical protein